MKDEEFVRWLRNNNTHYLFFDGASKSNPGMAGAGGLIWNGNGDVLNEYEWGLGHASNNRAEAFSLLQGLLQLHKLGISKATIIGDSAIIIGLMISNRKAQNLCLQQINERCHTLDQQMKGNLYYHVLRTLNKNADKLGNKACLHPLGNLRCNGTDHYFFLPWSGSIPFVDPILNRSLFVAYKALCPASLWRTNTLPLTLWLWAPQM